MRFVLTLVMLIALFAGAGHGVTITGKVTDSDGEPLPSVSVITNVHEIGTQTAVDGSFTLVIPDVPGGETVERVTFSSVGYRSRQFARGRIPEVVVLQERYYRSSDIIVRADRAEVGRTPVAFEDISAGEIERDYTVGEFPLLLNETPNVYAYSDGGTSLGYSYLSVRGFGGQRVATYINGVPLNDPEDHYTYFVDLPDFGANISDIQVQRGIGNTPYGATSFGGSVDVVSSVFSKPRRTVLSTGYGQYTHDGDFIGREISKQSVEYASGLVDGRWAFYGRFSRQKTSGYRINSWYHGWSYYLAVGRLDHDMSTELHLFGGPVRMHLAYRGASRDDIAENRLVNYYEYANETDNFNQPHYQLHNTYRINDRVTLENTIFYVRGKGYYEQFKDGRDYADYNLTAFSDSSWGDLVRQKWVEKNQVGWNPRLELTHARGSHSFGGSFYYYESNHWGQVVAAQFIDRQVDPTHRYYEYESRKLVGSFFAQEKYELNERLILTTTAELQYERRELDQEKIGAFAGYDFDLDWLFFSPRFGVNYRLDEHTGVYMNAAVASRAPNDENIYDADDPNKFPQLEIKSRVGDSLYEFGDPTLPSERVVNLEIGGTHSRENYRVGLNVFWMCFSDENVFEGGVDEYGREITIAIDESVRAGLELSATARPVENLSVEAALALNYNRITDYDTTLYYTVDSAGVERDESVVVSFDDNKVPNFPDYLGNFMFDYNLDKWRLTWHGRMVGRQYVEPANIEALSIDPYFTSSLTAAFSLDDFLRLGRLTVSATVDNLFDAKYESSGYGGDFVYREPGQTVVMDGWGEYFVAAERSFYAQVKLELF